LPPPRCERVFRGSFLRWQPWPDKFFTPARRMGPPCLGAARDALSPVRRDAPWRSRPSSADKGSDARPERPDLAVRRKPVCREKIVRVAERARSTIHLAMSVRFFRNNRRAGKAWLARRLCSSAQLGTLYGLARLRGTFIRRDTPRRMP
jgi:hypothetical protein